MARTSLAIFLLMGVAAGCGGRSRAVTGDDYDTEDLMRSSQAEAPRLTHVQMGTEVDTINWSCGGTTGRRFDRAETRLYACFRVEGAGDGGLLEAAWYRAGDDEPLSTSSQRIDGDGRLAAEHVVERAFLPGPHFVRITLDGETIGEIEFEVTGEAPRELASDEAMSAIRVTDLALYGGLAKGGRPRGRPVTRYSAKTRALYCAFRAHDVPEGTHVEVHWLREGEPAAVTDLGQTSGTRLLSASVGRRRPFPRGRYQVQVRFNGVTRATRSFTVGRVGPSLAHVSGLAFTTAVHPRTRRPAAPTREVFHGDEETIWLCASYAGLASGSIVEVRWVQGDHDDEPMAVSTIRVDAPEGSFAASFSPDGALPEGEYHADVVIDGDVRESASFRVE